MFTLKLLIINVIILFITALLPDLEIVLILMYIDLGSIITNAIHLFREDE